MAIKIYMPGNNNEKHNVRSESKDSNNAVAKKKQLQANQNQSVEVHSIPPSTNEICGVK